MNNIEASDDLSAPPPGVSGGGPYAIFQNRDFTFYLVGRLVGITGQQMFTIAILWEIYALTHSALALGLVGLVQMIPMFLFTLPAGHVADNYNRKRIVVLTTAAIAAASLGVAFISWRHAPVIWIYFCLFVGSAANTFMWAANAAFLPALVARKDFPRAVNWNAGAFQLSCIIGRAAAGGLIAWMVWHYFNHLNDPAAAAPVYVINALASVVVCVLVGMIRRRAHRQSPGIHDAPGAADGFQVRLCEQNYFGHHHARHVRGVFGRRDGAAADLCRGYFVRRADRPWLFGGGAAAGFHPLRVHPESPAAPAKGRARAVVGRDGLRAGHDCLRAFEMVLVFVSHAVPCGAVDNISVVVRHTLVQMLTPDDKRGRVSAVNNLFIGTSNELGEFESGTVAQIFGPAIGNTMVAGAVISVVSGGIGTVLTVIAVALIWPEIRRYGKLA